MPQSGREPPVEETPPTRETLPQDTLRRWDPERIGPYVVLGRLGSGSMGQVYLGRSAAGRLVAVKTIRVELAEEAGFRHRFAQEVAAARKVSGVFTAAVVEADPEADLPWLATAYVPAPSLARLVTACGPLPVTTVRWLAAGCAEALASIHGAGLVHRDLKPSNVLVAPDGPRVIDFGVARAAERMGRTTSRGAVGTPAYMAPEQARDTHEASVASDVYSLGATLLFAATGHPPYQGVTVMDVLARLATEEPDLSGLPGELTELITSCMHRVPRQRPTSAAMLAQLGDFTEAQADPDEGHAYLPAAATALIEEYQRSPQLAALSEPDDDRSSDATAASYTELPAAYKPVPRRRPGTGSPGAGEVRLAALAQVAHGLGRMGLRRSGPGRGRRRPRCRAQQFELPGVRRELETDIRLGAGAAGTAGGAEHGVRHAGHEHPRPRPVRAEPEPGHHRCRVGRPGPRLRARDLGHGLADLAEPAAARAQPDVRPHGAGQTHGRRGRDCTPGHHPALPSLVAAGTVHRQGDRIRRQ